MANRKKKVYNSKSITEEKRNISWSFSRNTIFKTTEDIQYTLKDLLSEALQEILISEMNDHLGYEKYERSDIPNYRNGTKPKHVLFINMVNLKWMSHKTEKVSLNQIAYQKRKKDISPIDDKIITMYTKGCTQSR